jgi:hypothetical protein
MNPRRLEIEKKVQVRQTELLIQANPREITLRRPRKARTASGGMSNDENEAEELTPVTRFFGGTKTMENLTGAGRTATFTTSSLGNRFKHIFVLVGPPGDDIQEDDFFYINNIKYTVLMVDPETIEYQTRAVVVRYV